MIYKFFEFHGIAVKVLLLHNALTLHSLLADTQFEHMSVKGARYGFGDEGAPAATVATAEISRLFFCKLPKQEN